MNIGHNRMTAMQRDDQESWKRDEVRLIIRRKNNLVTGKKSLKPLKLCNLFILSVNAYLIIYFSTYIE